jgi:hypothetical protein
MEKNFVLWKSNKKVLQCQRLSEGLARKFAGKSVCGGDANDSETTTRER